MAGSTGTSELGHGAAAGGGSLAFIGRRWIWTVTSSSGRARWEEHDGEVAEVKSSSEKSRQWQWRNRDLRRRRELDRMHKNVVFLDEKLHRTTRMAGDDSRGGGELRWRLPTAMVEAVRPKGRGKARFRGPQWTKRRNEWLG